MTLWILLTLLVAIAVALLTVPLVRRYARDPDAPSAARAVYRDQIAEIDSQERGGAVSAEEAEALRIEAKRRLLAEDRFAEAGARPLGSAALGRLAIGLAALVALGSTLLYSRLGSPELAQAAPDPASPPPPTPAGGAPTQASLDQMAAQIEARLKSNPKDAEGWRMLGLTRYSLNQFQAAADAYGQAVALTPGNAELQSAYGEALVLAAQGQVTPNAKTAFARAVAADPQDARARYFLGLAKDQAGDREGAIDSWIAILNDAPPGAPYAAGIRQVVEAAAKQAGVDISGRIKLASAPAAETVTPPPLAAMAGAGGPGATTAGGIPNPSPEQMAAASRMPPSEQQAMIRGMVDRLAARLKSNPQDPEGWLRLIRARMVLGDAAAAAQARTEALAALTDPAARSQVEAGAKALGVPGA